MSFYYVKIKQTIKRLSSTVPLNYRDRQYMHWRAINKRVHWIPMNNLIVFLYSQYVLLEPKKHYELDFFALLLASLWRWPTVFFNHSISADRRKSRSDVAKKRQSLWTSHTTYKKRKQRCSLFLVAAQAFPSVTQRRRFSACWQGRQRGSEWRPLANHCPPVSRLPSSALRNSATE